MITDIPGSSEYLLGSVVTYSNMAKQKLVNVSAENLEKYGAVSEQVACEMASGVRDLWNNLWCRYHWYCRSGGAWKKNL